MLSARTLRISRITGNCSPPMLNEANNSDRRTRLITALQPSCGKVMFSVQSVCVSVSHSVTGGVPLQDFGPVPLDFFKLVQLEPHCVGCPIPPNAHTHTHTHTHTFKLVQHRPYCTAASNPLPPGHIQTCSLYDARTVGKRAVGIRLGCFLVINDNRIAFPQLNPNIDSDFCRFADRTALMSSRFFMKRYTSQALYMMLRKALTVQVVRGFFCCVSCEQYIIFLQHRFESFSFHELWRRF